MTENHLDIDLVKVLQDIIDNIDSYPVAKKGELLQFITEASSSDIGVTDHELLTYIFRGWWVSGQSALPINEKMCPLCLNSDISHH